MFALNNRNLNIILSNVIITFYGPNLHQGCPQVILIFLRVLDN